MHERKYAKKGTRRHTGTKPYILLTSTPISAAERSEFNLAVQRKLSEDDDDFSVGRVLAFAGLNSWSEGTRRMASKRLGSLSFASFSFVDKKK